MHSPSAHTLDNSNATASSAAAAALVVASGGTKLGPALERFNQLLGKIEAAKAALIDLQGIEAKYWPERARRLEPLLNKVQALQARLVIFLDQRLLDPKGLSRKVEEDIGTLILCLADKLFDTDHPNPVIEEIYIRRSQGRDAPVDQAPVKTERHEFPSVSTGKERDESENVDSSEAWSEAAQEKAWAHRNAAKEHRAARRTQRKKAARQNQQAGEAQDASKALREIYRKLASTLHPDREPDLAERERKAALMAQVNIANDRRDLVALLELQLQIEQINPGDLAAMADEKLGRLNNLLEEQEKSLLQEISPLEERLRKRLNLAWNTPLSDRGIDAALRQQAQYFQAGIAMLQQQLGAIRRDAELKRWVRQQIELMAARIDGA